MLHSNRGGNFILVFNNLILIRWLLMTSVSTNDCLISATLVAEIKQIIGSHIRHQ